MVRVRYEAEENPEDHDLCRRSFVLAIKDAINVVSGKWKLAIVCALLSGPKGFANIERLLPEISPRMLSRELRELELNGVIMRVAGERGGASRNYALTASGQRLEQVIFMMATWGQEHRVSLSRENPAGGDYKETGSPSAVASMSK